MPEVKKIATRESYGNALVELGKKHDDVVVLMLTLQAQPRPEPSRRFFRSVTLTAASQRRT